MRIASSACLRRVMSIAQTIVLGRPWKCVAWTVSSSHDRRRSSPKGRSLPSLLEQPAAASSSPACSAFGSSSVTLRQSSDSARARARSLQGDGTVGAADSHRDGTLLQNRAQPLLAGAAPLRAC
jgi:hypothetical protein